MNGWDAVARVIADRMAERDLTQRELAERSGVSVATLREIQRGIDRRRSPVTLAAISRALGFPDDHLRRVLREGHLPASTVAAGVPQAVAQRLDQLRSELDDLHRRVRDIETRLRE
ncbi:MAG: helix-turn-helix domain-containing protein [Streptosporangiaceae bacterium]